MAKGTKHRSSTLKALTNCSDFESHEEIGTLLRSLEEQYSDIYRLFSIGTSVEERDLYAVRISAEPHLETVEPESRTVIG